MFRDGELLCVVLSPPLTMTVVSVVQVMQGVGDELVEVSFLYVMNNIVHLKPSDIIRSASNHIGNFDSARPSRL